MSLEWHFLYYKRNMFIIEKYVNLCVSQLYIPVAEYLRKTKESYIKLMVSEILIHCQEASLFLGLWWTSSSWWKALWSRAACFMTAGKQKGLLGGRGLETRCSFQGMSSRTLPSTRSHLLQFPPLPSSPFSYKSFSGLAHWWEQSSYDPIISQRPHLWTLHIGNQASHTWAFGNHSTSKS